MPKTTRMTQEAKDTAAEIRGKYNGALVVTVEQIGPLVGYKSRNSTLRWLEDLVPRYRGTIRVWLVSDVAQKICSTERAS